MPKLFTSRDATSRMVSGLPAAARDAVNDDQVRLARFLAFGIDMRVEQAIASIEAADGARRRWTDEHGIHEPSDGELLALLTELVRQALADARRRAPDAALTMGLSGGYDSRPLLHILHTLGERPRLHTFGQPGNIDFDVAGILDAQLDLGVLRIDSNAVRWSLDEYDAEAHITTDLPISPRVHAERHIDDLVGPRIDVHGLINGALTGAGAVPDDGPIDEHLSAFAAANDPFAFQSLLGPSAVRAVMPTEVVSADRGLSPFRQLDIGFRQHQRIRLPDREGRVYAYPYIAPAWMGLWLTRPHEQLVDQRRWMQFVRRLPPRLFADLHGLDGDRREARRARLARLYGTAGQPGWAPLPPGIEAPRNPTDHFCLRATARNNPSFAAMIAESLHRLRGRRVVDAALIDRVEQRFAADDATAARMLNGLVTLDTCLEAGRFTA